MTFSAQDYARQVLLKDGTPMLLRSVRPADKKALLDLFYRLSPRSVYFRFFQAKTRLTDEELAYFTELDHFNRVALVAVRAEGGGDKIMGVGRYSVLRDSEEKGPLRAEVAFAVDDRLQGRGLGTQLLEHLLPLARQRGVEEFEADVLGENNRMIQMFDTFGLTVSRALAGGVIHVRFPTRETPDHELANFNRHVQAAAASLEPLFYPASVALVGASEKPASIGRSLAENLMGQKHRPLALVNPHAATILGQAAFSSLAQTPFTPDLVVVAVPQTVVEDVVRQAVEKGAKAVVVISSGFAETGAKGLARQKRLAEICIKGGARLVGPNCMGLVNTSPKHPLNATFTQVFPPHGKVGFLSQSGALGLAMMAFAQAMGVGISTFISVGNGADVNHEDLLAWWLQDDQTQVAALYLESFGHPRFFARLAQEVSRKKPLLVVKSGKSVAGQRAAQSHSAALASNHVAAQTLFEQVGVVRVDTLEELLMQASFFSSQPLPQGPGVGIVTNAGGPAILLADSLEAEGLAVPPLHPGTVQALKAFLPEAASLHNPVDLIASATPRQMEDAIACVGADEAVSSVVAVYIEPLKDAGQAMAEAISRGASRLPPGKPFQCVFISPKPAPKALRAGPGGAFPVFPFPENAARTLASALRYAGWRARPVGQVFTPSRFVRDTVRSVVDRLMAEKQGGGWIKPSDISVLLHAVGIKVVYSETAPPDPEQAALVAERLGYPCVAKVIAPGVLLKTEVGGVMLNLMDADAVKQAVSRFQETLSARGLKLEGVLIQPQMNGGVEAFVGMTRYALFGPLLMVGVGGVQVELLKDIAFGVASVTDVRAREMLQSLRAWPLLTGFRGDTPKDAPALENLLMRLCALAELAPEIQEVDLNPVKVLGEGEGAWVLDGRLRLQ